jgi:hypothetical protein
VRIQIAVALIAYLLLRITQATHGLTLSLQRLAGLVQRNLMHRKTLHQIVHPVREPPPQPDPRQGLLWA